MSSAVTCLLAYEAQGLNLEGTGLSSVSVTELALEAWVPAFAIPEGPRYCLTSGMICQSQRKENDVLCPSAWLLFRPVI